MKTNLLRNISLLLLGGAVAAAAADKIIIRGSNTIGEDLAPKLIAEFRKDHPDVAFDTEFKGTGYGLGGLSAAACDIAAASRVASTNEVDLLKENGVDLSDHVIGAYSVAVVVNAANPVKDLTKNQVRDIFTGAIQNWKAVGGPDAPIHLYIRNPISGTFLGFQEIAMGNKPYGHMEKTFTSYADVVAAVAQDAGGIGYGSLDVAKHDGAKTLTIGGLSADATTVNKGAYPYSRVLRLYTNKLKETPGALAFIEFVQSARGQEVLAKAGFVPHP